MAKISIQRFSGPNEMSSSKFVEIANVLARHNKNGIIEADGMNIQLQEKFDGTNMRIGIDEGGTIYMESSNVGPITIENIETIHPDKMPYLADHYKSFISMMKAGHIPNILRMIHEGTYNDDPIYQGPVKFICELFPMTTHEIDFPLIFNSTAYAPKKMGTAGTLVVLDVEIPMKTENDENVVKKKVQEVFCEADSQKWRVYGPAETNIVDSYEFTPNLQGAIPLEEMAVHLKQRDEVAQQLKDEVIPKMKEEFQQWIDTIAEGVESQLGDEWDTAHYPVEGVVLTIVDDQTGKTYKVKGTSQSFDNRKKVLWEPRTKIKGCYTNLRERILCQGFNIDNPHQSVISSKVKKTIREFRSKGISPEARLGDFMECLMRNLGAHTNAQKVQETIKSSVLRAKRQINEIKKQWNKISKKFDVNTRRKTENELGLTMGGPLALLPGAPVNRKYRASKIGKLDTLSQNNYGDDKTYLANVLGSLLESQLDKIKEACEPMYEEDTGEVIFSQNEPTPVIAMWGRFQPFTKGHNRLVQQAKSKLEECEAQKVVVFICCGKDDGKITTRTKKELRSPLTFVERYKILREVFADDERVDVCPMEMNTGYLPTILEKIDDANMNIVIKGIAAGEDRADTYRGNIEEIDDEEWLKTRKTKPAVADDCQMIALPRSSVQGFDEENISATHARNNVKMLDKKMWIETIAPPDLTPEAKKQYEAVYEKFETIYGEGDQKEYRDMLRGILNERD